MASILWAMPLTYGRILLGPQYSMRWRERNRSVLVSQSFAHDTRIKSRSSPSLVNCRLLHLWVRTRTVLPVPHLHPAGGCILPCEFKLPCGHTCRSLVRCFVHSGTHSYLFLYLCSVTRTSTTTRAHCVTRTVLQELCALGLHKPAPASTPVEIVYSRSPT